MVEISSGEDTSKSSTFVLLNNDPTGKAEALVMSQPVHLQLGQNYPNPFNASTRIQFQLDHNEMVELSVFDCTGRKIRTLLHSSKEAGEYSVLWKGVDDSGRTVASGVYIILLRIGQNERRVRTVLLR